MTRTTKTLRIAGLNIVTHPHSATQYVEMLKRARTGKIAGNYYGNRWGSIGSFSQEGDAYRGFLHLYTDFDESKPWIDIDRGEQADEEDLKAVKIPKNLRPEFTQVPFVFFPKEHKLLYEQIISPNSASRLMEAILREKTVKAKVEEVHAHVIQDKSAISTLLKKPKLRRLEVFVTRPNPDDLASLEDKLEKRLKKLKSDSLTETYTSNDENLTPDSELTALCDLASTNGRVSVQFRNSAGVTETATSASSPKQHIEKYSPEETTAIDRLFAAKSIFM